jgi:hypothetical protein
MRRDEEPLHPDIAERFVKSGNAQVNVEPESNDVPKPEPPVHANTSPHVRRSQATKTARPSKHSAIMTPGLISVNVRVSPEVAGALQAASLQRQLQGLQPSSKREIVEEALRPWLQANGYL